MKNVLLFPLYRCGNFDSKGSRLLPKVLRLVDARPGMWTSLFGLQGPHLEYDATSRLSRGTRPRPPLSGTETGWGLQPPTVVVPGSPCIALKTHHYLEKPAYQNPPTPRHLSEASSELWVSESGNQHSHRNGAPSSPKRAHCPNMVGEIMRKAAPGWRVRICLA